MAKRKKGSKVQSRAKLRRTKPAKRGKARKAAHVFYVRPSGRLDALGLTVPSGVMAIADEVIE